MLEGREYVPLLYARLAEIRAMRELPEVSKNLLVPVFKLRPWLNSKTLARALEVIEEAVGNRLYGLDLDDFKFEANPDPEKPARVEFARLFEHADGFTNYYELVGQGDNRVPVFRSLNSEHIQIDRQLDHVAAIGRGVFVRAKVTEPGALLNVAQAIADREIDNPVYVLDCGWGADILSQAAIAAQQAQNLVDISHDIEVVIAGSSFPNAFSGMGGRFQINAIERQVYSEVRRLVNFPALYYGDWGSTRPPTDPVPMRNVPRIDIARSDNWLSWRSEDEEDYIDVAERVIADPAWDGQLGIWGEYMILATAAEEDVRIKAPAMAAAVRVNLHLHQQANFGHPDALHIGDEMVGDDL
jgi:hypothetical protein